MVKNMIKYLRDAFTKDLGLKLMSFVFAALLWLLVVNLDDPTQSRNFTATVDIENENVLTDQGKYYSLTDGNTVTFRVTARRSVIEDLSGSDFTATADMNNLEDDVRIPVHIEANRHASQVSISTKTHYISISVGDTAQTNFTVKEDITGEPADGFAVGDIALSPSTISVDGPTDVVSTIDYVSVSYDVSDLKADVSEILKPVFYTKDGKEVDTTLLTLSATSVQIDIDIVSVKEVGISVETSGTLADGLELSEITTDPAKVKLLGDAQALNSITTITIPSDVINLTEITDQFETTVDIETYLPDGVSVSDDSSKVTITVKINKEQTKEYKIKTANLTVRNLDDGLTAEFSDSAVTVTITGMSASLSELSENSITGYVDASGLAEGTHAVGVELELGDGLSADAASTTLVLKKTE